MEGDETQFALRGNLQGSWLWRFDDFSYRIRLRHRNDRRLTTSSSGALSDSNFSFGLNRSSSDDATVARKLGKWLTDCPLFHEDAARTGYTKM